MSFTRRFHGEPTERLIVSIPVKIVDQIDQVIGYHQWGFKQSHPAHGNRSEFVRLAIAEKLARDTTSN